MISKRIIHTVLLVSALSALPLFAQDEFDESVMFGDTSSLVDSAKIINTAAASAAFDEKKTTFSGI